MPLQHIITSGSRLFYRFSNADGKTWLMPARNMRVSMNLYQPSGRNGKIVKILFPRLHYLPFIRKIIRAESVHCCMNKELQHLFSRLFLTTKVEYSIFCGTPSVHQKITIQISKNKQILGYCKATDSDEINTLFQGEAYILNWLHLKDIENIPKCLFCGTLSNGIKLFVQSTTKSLKSEIIHEWTELHDDFLKKLYQNTHQSIYFEDSDYYRTLIDFEQHIDWLPSEVNCFLIKTILYNVLSRLQGQKVDFSAYHADFTPWNMFVEDSQLFVFDWEYARMSYPPMLDRYHFFTQTAIFEKHWQVEEITTYLQSNKGNWINQEMYTLYLLDMIGRFTIREKGNVKGDIARSMKIWNDLLKYMNA